MRGKGHRRPNGNIVSRVYESSGPEGKVRGNPQQIIDKYQALARDAYLAGDRVLAENHAQHAEHFIRLLSEATRELEARRAMHMAQQTVDRSPNGNAATSHGNAGKELNHTTKEPPSSSLLTS